MSVPKDVEYIEVYFGKTEKRRRRCCLPSHVASIADLFHGNDPRAQAKTCVPTRPQRKRYIRVYTYDSCIVLLPIIYIAIRISRART